MIWYAQEEKEEPKPELRLKGSKVNGRMCLELIVRGIRDGMIPPPDIDPTDIPQALDGLSLTFGAPPNDNSLKTRQTITYRDLAVEILNIKACPFSTCYTIQFNYKG